MRLVGGLSDGAERRVEVAVSRFSTTLLLLPGTRRFGQTLLGPLRRLADRNKHGGRDDIRRPL
ncbi:hypothetical protein CC79DRAFT_1335017 [Sarocladium strictum]